MVANVEIKVLSTSSSSSLPNEQQNDHSAAENDSINNVRVISSKSESSMGRRVNAVMISAKANNSAPAILSTAVQDLLKKASVVASKTDSSDSATWDGFRDLFTSSFESIAKLGSQCTANNESVEPLSPDDQRTQKSSNEKIANVAGGVSVTDVFADAINLFAMNLLTSPVEELNTDVKEKVSSEDQLKTKSKSTFGARSFSSVTRQEEYESADKLELRYAIAKASNFYEFVRLYSNGVENTDGVANAPSIPQMIRMAELLFKDYQRSVVHQLSDA